MNILFSLALATAVGLVFNRLAKLIGLPNVTGYLIAGLLIGPFVLDLFGHEALKSASVLTEVALGFIAFSIGGEFKWAHLKSVGRTALIITLFQALTACLLVDVTLIALGFPLPLAITLGAIATATAPAATLMVVRQYKAHGPLTGMLLPVVALDDAVGLMAFSISIALAKVFDSGAALTASAVLLEPLLEIVGSLVIGTVLGFVMVLALRFFRSRANRLSVTLCGVVLGLALSQMFHLSSLLLCMAVGTVMANFCDVHERVMDINDVWTSPLFLLFFVISGAELDLSAIPAVGLLGVAYLLARSLGKYFGSFAGACVTKADRNIRNYLGITLLPQAGVAIGMSQIAVTALPAYGDLIRTVTLCATLVYELVGPLMTKWSLAKAGEIEKSPKKEKNLKKA
ncbi:MAG: cation:proton antiporter [Clostridia bacterium]|nr:cation:proton antiporter [Clostridia bacterium]